MTERRRFDRSIPAHVGVILGFSTGAYALAVAGVAGLQSSAEAAISAERAPAIEAIEALRSAHDQLGSRLDRARAAYGMAAGAYDAAGLEVADLQARIDRLATSVSEVSAAAAALPGGVRLPAISRPVAVAGLPSVSRSVAVAQPPPVQATTRASGG